MFTPDFLRQFDPHQYAIDAGWDYTSIEKTAELGVAEADEENLLSMAREFGLGEEEAEIAADEASEKLLQFCKRRVSQTD